MTMDVTAPKHARGEATERVDPEHRDEAKIQPVVAASDDVRREHSRFCVDLDVTIGSDHNFYAGFAENLSAGGVFIATHNLKPVGSKIDLRINLPDGAQVRAAGDVRWIRIFNEHSDTPPGLGVRFTDLDAASVSAVQTFLSRREPLFFDDE
jgi:uncharacterized protein (TIGR02266 family)